MVDNNMIIGIIVEHDTIDPYHLRRIINDRYNVYMPLNELCDTLKHIGVTYNKVCNGYTYKTYDDKQHVTYTHNIVLP